MEVVNKVRLLKVIQERRSRRAYLPKLVEPEKIQTLFEAARWAPSSVNEQPWMYIYASKDQDKLWSKLFEALSEGNKIWAHHAPLLILSLVRKNFKRDERPNRSARYDVGAANAFLSLQATDLGLNVHQMGGFNAQKVSEALNVPEEFEPVVIMAIGYPGNPENLPENLKQREIATRQRIERENFVMNQAF